MPVPFLMSWKDVQHTSNSTSLTQMLFFFTFKIKLRRGKTPLMGTVETATGLFYPYLLFLIGAKYMILPAF